MIPLAATIWTLWMIFGGNPPTITNLPANSAVECDGLKRQMKEKLKPARAECIEVPIYKPVQ